MSDFSSSPTTAVDAHQTGVDVDYILSAQAVRERAHEILRLTREGRGEFEVHLDRLDEVADFVLQVIREKYPTLDIPYHSRFNHFHVGGVDRETALNERISQYSEVERARIKIDLVVTSVLLDAGAGNDWKYIENGHVYSRSEGLAV